MTAMTYEVMTNESQGKVMNDFHLWKKKVVRRDREVL